MKVVIFSVVYNNLKDTILFCDSIASQIAQNDIEIYCYLVDNSSAAEISAALDLFETTYSFVKILRSGKNLGYFGAFNYAFTYGFHSDAQYTLLCNNDLIFENDFFSKLYLKKYNNNYLAICPDVITPTGHHQNPHVIKPLGFYGRLKLDLYFSHYYIACILGKIKDLLRYLYFPLKKTAPNYKLSAMTIHMGIGACYILPAVFFNYADRLKYPFFLYGEEAFLSKQIHDVNGELYFDPSLKVLHAESATLSKAPRRTTYEFAREGYAVYRKFY